MLEYKYFVSMNRPSSTFQVSSNFANSVLFLTKVNLLSLLCLTDHRSCHLLLVKQNYLQKTFPRTRIFKTQASL